MGGRIEVLSLLMILASRILQRTYHFPRHCGPKGENGGYERGPAMHEQMTKRHVQSVPRRDETGRVNVDGQS